MARVVMFGTGEIDRARFRYLFSAALAGPTMARDERGQPKERSWAQQRQDGAIIRLLKAVSEEQRVKRSPDETDDTAVRYRVLKADGGQVTLTGDQYDMLRRWWGLIQWPTYDIDAVEDCWEWLCSAPEAP